MEKGKKISRGKIIVIDGIDGSGKKTQTELLVKRLKKLKIKAVRMDFPQYENNFFGQNLKRFLADPKYGFLNVHPKLGSIVYAADRWESKGKIQKYLNAGYIVVLDRYVSSNQIHQGGKYPENEEGLSARKDFMKWLDTMEHKIFKIPRPNIILYLSLSLETVRKMMLRRAETEKHRIDLVDQDVEYQKKSLDSAKRLATEIKNMKIVDCSDEKSELGIKTREAIADLIFSQIKKLL